MEIEFQIVLAEFNKDTPDWYGWINPEDGEVLSNVQVVKDGATVPTQAQFDSKKAELQVQQDRAFAYASIQEQLDMQYWDNVNGTTTWKDHIAQVKSDNPKPS